MEALGPNDPTTVGNYQLTAVLGSGGMGRVYLAHSPSGRRVAVKVIQADLVQEPEIRQRFSREVAAARSVSGFFTASVIDANVDANPPWLVTTYIAGPSLRAAVRQVGPLPVASVRAIGAALAEALSAIHAVGLIHRDLKPGNILLASDGPRLIDFGISSLAGSATVTRVGAIMGSPGYMAPEQVEGRPIGPPTDVFALGAVLAFAATGRDAFGGDSFPSLLYQTVHAEPDLSGVPAELLPLMTSCLDKDPARRPDLGTVLREFTHGQNLASMFAPGWLPAALIRDTEPTLPGADAPTTRPNPADEAAQVAHAAPTRLPRPRPPAEAPTTSPSLAEAMTTSARPAETLAPHPAEAPTTRPPSSTATPAVLGVPATPVATPSFPPAPDKTPLPGPQVQPAWSYGQPPPAPGAGSPTRPPARRRGLIAGIVAAVAVVAVVGILVLPRLLSGGTPEPKASGDVKAVPAVGTCYLAGVSSKFDPVADRAEQVACKDKHTLETIASGKVDAAANREPPAVTSRVARDLYAKCETAAEKFLGAPWRTKYTMLVLSLPSAEAWKQGATWYRCDLAASDFSAQTTTVQVTGTLKGKADPITCLSFTYQGKALGDIQPSSCTAPHHGELAGLVRLPDGDLTGDALSTELSNRCQPVVLKFLDASGLAKGLTFWSIRDDTANTLDRNVLCLVAIEQNRGTLIRSLRGIGDGAIPVG